MYFTAQYKDNQSDVIRQHFGKKRSLSFISNASSTNKNDDANKQQRRVRFSEAQTEYKLDQETEPFSPNNIWYSKRELAAFTKEAQNFVLGYGHLFTDETTRGYERYDFGRMKQKATTRKVILLLTKQNVLSDDEKSLIAQNSSSWAVEEAFAQGCIDFCNAYHPGLTQTLQEHRSLSTNQQPTKKRKLNKPYRNIGSRAA